jgi:hypothetical protein
MAKEVMPAARRRRRDKRSIAELREEDFLQWRVGEVLRRSGCLNWWLPKG